MSTAYSFAFPSMSWCFQSSFLVLVSLDLVRVFYLRPMYLQCFCTHSLDVLFPTLGEFHVCEWLWYPLTFVSGVEYGYSWNINLYPNFCPGRGLNPGPFAVQSSMQPLDHRASSSCLKSSKSVIEGPTQGPFIATDSTEVRISILGVAIIPCIMARRKEKKNRGS